MPVDAGARKIVPFLLLIGEAPVTPTVVLLPGLDGTGDLFARFVSVAGDSNPTAIVRYPTRGALTYAELTRIAAASLPPNRPFVLLGESFSGPIAISLAYRNPRGIVGLILCASFARAPYYCLRTLRVLASCLPTVAAERCAAASLLMGRYKTRELHLELRRALAKVERGVIRYRTLQLLSVDVSRELQQVSVPSLYIRASDDRLVPRTASEVFATHALNARIVEITGPHMLLQCVPEKVLEVLTEFMRRLPASDELR